MLIKCLPLSFFSIFFQLILASVCCEEFEKISVPLLEWHEHAVKNKERDVQDNTEYPYNPCVELETWNKLKPYFLPYHHPVKSILDEIFQSGSVTFNRESFIEAGFKVHKPKAPTNLVVGKHPRLKGYLVKAYFDDQRVCEWDNFFKRVTGAQSIQQCINKHGYQKQFKVPKKWIYPLPLESLLSNHQDEMRKNFVLIVEDMDILDQAQNAKYFNTKITHQILDDLYTIITEEGLIDSVFRGNIPFNKKGKICFIDTEHHHLWPVPYERLSRYLSPKMESYWKNLTDR